MASHRLRVAAAFSLVVFLAVVYVWVQSYHGFQVRAHDGAVVLLFIPASGIHPEGHQEAERGYFNFIQRLVSTEPTARQGGLLGISYFQIPSMVSGIRIPFAYVAVIPLALFVAFASLLRRQRRRERLGLCLRCGYDLRESGGTCPECGRKAVPGV